MQRTSVGDNFSPIIMKAKIPANTGPVVKLIQLDTVKGINEMAQYCETLEVPFITARKNTAVTAFLSYLLKSRSTLRYNA